MPAFVLARLSVDVAPGDLQAFQNTVYGGFHIVAHGLDPRVQIDDGGIAFGGGT